MELRLIGFVMAFKLRERQARLLLTPWVQDLSARRIRADLGSIIRIAPGFEVVPCQYPVHAVCFQRESMGGAQEADRQLMIWCL